MKNVFIIIFLLISQLAFSQKTIVTDRPDQTESAISVPLGSLQIESGFLYEWVGPNMSLKNYAIPTTLFRYGILKNFELRFQADYLKLKTSLHSLSGFGDFSIGMKAHIFAGDITDIAILVNTIIPSGDKSFREPRSSYNGILCISHELSDKIGLGYNVGLNYDQYKDLNLTYAIAIGFALTEKLSAFTEVFGSWNSFKTVEVSFDLGFTYLLNNNLQLDASFGKGINFESNFLSFGISWRILPN